MMNLKGTRTKSINQSIKQGHMRRQRKLPSGRCWVNQLKTFPPIRFIQLTMTDYRGTVLWKDESEIRNAIHWWLLWAGRQVLWWEGAHLTNERGYVLLYPPFRAEQSFGKMLQAEQQVNAGSGIRIWGLWCQSLRSKPGSCRQQLTVHSSLTPVLVTALRMVLYS